MRRHFTAFLYSALRAFMSECRDSNPESPRPKRGMLAVTPHSDIKEIIAQKTNMYINLFYIQKPHILNSSRSVRRTRSYTFIKMNVWCVVRVTNPYVPEPKEKSMGSQKMYVRGWPASVCGMYNNKINFSFSISWIPLSFCCPL